MTKKDILESISADEALTVLQELVASNQTLRKRAEKIAFAMLTDVDVEEVAEEVFMALESLRVEDVWDNSGSTREGYIDTGTCAWGMFDDALKPVIQQMPKCQLLSLHEQAKAYCMGILKGIRCFETESESEFKNWAIDAPGEYFVSTYRDWKKEARNKKEVAEVRRFINSLCPERQRYCQ